MTRTPRTPCLSDLPEVRFGLAEAALLMAATVSRRLDVDARVGLVVLGTVAAACCLALAPRFRCAVGVSAWAFLTGFVVHTGGQLTLGRSDLERLGALVAVALVASALPWLSRRARAAGARGRARPVAAPHG